MSVGRNAIPSYLARDRKPREDVGHDSIVPGALETRRGGEVPTDVSCAVPTIPSRVRPPETRLALARTLHPR